MDESLDENLLSELSLDELAEVLEEWTGVEFSDEQALGIRQLIESAGSLPAALELLEKLAPLASEDRSEKRADAA